MSIYYPFSEGNWLFFGDESGASIPGTNERFACYSTVAVPSNYYKEFKSELPTFTTKKGYRKDDYEKVFQVLLKIGGLANSVYFDFKDARVSRVQELIELNREKSTIPNTPTAFHYYWVYLVGFSYLEVLNEIAQKGLPINECSFIYDEFKTHKIVEKGMKQFFLKSIHELYAKFINDTKSKSKAAEDYFKRTNPTSGMVKAGRTKEPGVAVADLIGQRTLFFLKNKNSSSRHKISNFTNCLELEDPQIF